MRTLAILVALSLCSCGVDAQDEAFDQCLRVELFERCMKAIPPGPTTTEYNDWDEVVASCDNASYYQSLRPAWSIKPECRRGF